MTLIRPTSVQQARRIIMKRAVGRVQAVPSPEGPQDTRHWYAINGGAPHLSITQKNGIVAKPHLYLWYGRKAIAAYLEMEGTITDENKLEIAEHCSKAGERVKTDAGDVGTAGHQAVDDWLQEWIAADARPTKEAKDYLPSDADPRAIAFCRSVKRFFDENPHYIPAWSELRVGFEMKVKGRKVGTVGTMDILLWNTNTNELEVWDWKSSNSVDVTYSLQVGAYWKALQKMTNMHLAPFCGIVRGSKWDDRPTLYKVPDAEGAWQAYLHGSLLYDYVEDKGNKPQSWKERIDLTTIT